MPYYSFSKLETFENCPLRYKFNYLDKIRRDEESIEAFLGSRFHETMERLYQELKFRIIPLEELIDYYNDLWNKNYHENIFIVKKERCRDDYQKLGEKCIVNYYHRYYPFNRGRTLAIEKRVDIDLDGSKTYLLQGFIDRIDRLDDGTYEIHDYKTSSYLPEQKQKDKDKQLALYQLGLQNLWNNVEKVNLVWHYVVFDQEIISTRSIDELETLKSEIISLIKKIENTEEFLPKESNLCAWCSYVDLCPLKKHQHKVEELTSDKFLQDDGVKLVNTYVELDIKKAEYKKREKEIEEQLEKLEKKIIEYAGQEGLELIIGSDHQLRISEKKKISLPAKNSDSRKELENILKEINKLEEVSTLDTTALQKKIVEREWEEDILEKIKKFYQFEIKKYVKLLKLK
ncbi:MAG: hypothetical protein Kow00103_13550 [Candidatus Caldatribacteriota bacterium]